MNKFYFCKKDRDRILYI